MCNGPVHLSLSHFFTMFLPSYDHEILPLTKVMSMQKVSVRGQRSGSWSGCPIVFRGHPFNFKVTQAKKIINFTQISVFPGDNSSFNSEMPIKWSKVLRGKEEVPNCYLQQQPYNFSRSSVHFQGHMGLKIDKLVPISAFTEDGSSFNSQIAMNLVWSDEQSFEEYRSGTLLFKVICPIS